MRETASSSSPRPWASLNAKGRSSRSSRVRSAFATGSAGKTATKASSRPWRGARGSSPRALGLGPDTSGRGSDESGRPTPAIGKDRPGPGDGDDVSAGRFRPSPHGPGTVGLPVGDEDRRGAGSAPDADRLGALSAGSFRPSRAPGQSRARPCRRPGSRSRSDPPVRRDGARGGPHRHRRGVPDRLRGDRPRSARGRGGPAASGRPRPSEGTRLLLECGRRRPPRRRHGRHGALDGPGRPRPPLGGEGEPQEEPAGQGGAGVVGVVAPPSRRGLMTTGSYAAVWAGARRVVRGAAGRCSTKRLRFCKQACISWWPTPMRTGPATRRNPRQSPATVQWIRVAPRRETNSIVPRMSIGPHVLVYVTRRGGSYEVTSYTVSNRWPSRWIRCTTRAPR